MAYSSMLNVFTLSDYSPTVETRGVRGVENEGFTDDVIPAS